VRRKAHGYAMCNNRFMVKRVKNRLKRPIPPNHIKAWRDYRGYTQEDMVDRFLTMFEVETTVASVSRYEASKQPVDIDMLNMFAEILMTSPTALMSRPPGVEAGIEEVWSSVPDADKPQAMLVLKTFARSKVANG